MQMTGIDLLSRCAVRGANRANRKIKLISLFILCSNGGGNRVTSLRYRAHPYIRDERLREVWFGRPRVQLGRSLLIPRSA
jgi:hypothetical protein